MVARGLFMPKEYRAGWKTLIEQPLAAGHISPSNFLLMFAKAFHSS